MFDRFSACMCAAPDTKERKEQGKFTYGFGGQMALDLDFGLCFLGIFVVDDKMSISSSFARSFDFTGSAGVVVRLREGELGGLSRHIAAENFDSLRA